MALWNSGRRESGLYRSERAKLDARLTLHRDRDRDLRTRYGTHWPPTELQAFVAEESALNGWLETLEEDQFQPWFPQKLIDTLEGELVKVDDLESPRGRRLLKGLWCALEELVKARTERPRRGEPHLNKQQRQELTRIHQHVSLTIRAAGPDVKATQALIGNWAEIPAFRGLNFVQVIDALCILDSELAMRLAEKPREAGNPVDEAFKRFCLEVVMALATAGETISKYRNGSTACVIRTLLDAAELRVPRDLFRHIERAENLRPTEMRRRANRRNEWREYFPPARRP